MEFKETQGILDSILTRYHQILANLKQLTLIRTNISEFTDGSKIYFLLLK